VPLLNWNNKMFTAFSCLHQKLLTKQKLISRINIK